MSALALWRVESTGEGMDAWGGKGQGCRKLGSGSWEYVFCSKDILRKIKIFYHIIIRLSSAPWHLQYISRKSKIVSLDHLKTEEENGNGLESLQVQLWLPAVQGH